MFSHWMGKQQSLHNSLGLSLNYFFDILIQLRKYSWVGEKEDLILRIDKILFGALYFGVTICPWVIFLYVLCL